MDLKSAINIILRDLKEAGDLIDDLGNKPDFPRLQVELAKSKCKSAEELIRLIGEIIADYHPERNEHLQEETKEELQDQLHRVAQKQQEKVQEQQGEQQEKFQEETPKKQDELQAEPPKQQEQHREDEEAQSGPGAEDPGLFDNDMLDLEEDLEEITKAEDQHDDTLRADTGKDSTQGEKGHIDSIEPGQGKKSERIVADKFSHLASRINEKVGESKKSEGKARTMPVTDLNRALGINDRFYFIRELFNGNENSFRETIDRLNKADSKEEATSILSESVKDISDSGPALELLELVERKLSAK
jgi:hypothetical protein